MGMNLRNNYGPVEYGLIRGNGNEKPNIFYSS